MHDKKFGLNLYAYTLVLAFSQAEGFIPGKFAHSLIYQIKVRQEYRFINLESWLLIFVVSILRESVRPRSHWQPSSNFYKVRPLYRIFYTCSAYDNVNNQMPQSPHFYGWYSRGFKTPEVQQWAKISIKGYNIVLLNARRVDARRSIGVSGLEVKTYWRTREISSEIWNSAGREDVVERTVEALVITHHKCCKWYKDEIPRIQTT